MKKVLIISREGIHREGYRFIGFVEEGERIHSKILNTRGIVEDLSPLIDKNSIDEVYLAFPSLTPEEMFHIREQCPKRVKQIHFVSNLYDALSHRINLKTINGIPQLTLKGNKIKGLHRLIKRSVDLLCSVLGILLCAPLFFIIAILIKGTMPGPVFFRQKRLGKDGKKFIFYKFRTMNENGENPHKEFMANFIKKSGSSRGTYKLREDSRITRLGYFLRRSSLDELPQLINVFRGEMSLVGPRPAIPYEIIHYQKWHKRRLSAKPGITGLWQVSGRSSVSFNDMVLLDLYYIDNWSLWLDFLLLIKTIPAVLTEKGAY